MRKPKPHEPDKALDEFAQAGSNILHVSANKLKELGYKGSKAPREGSLLEAAKGLYIILDAPSARGVAANTGPSKILNK